ARELGQPVALAPPGNAPEAGRSLVDGIAVPGARLALAVDGEDAAAFLAEARVIEAGQADAEMVRELWSGIVASVAAGLGGKAAPIAAEALGAAAEPCALRLGNTVLRMALHVEATEIEAVAPTPVRDAPSAASSRPVGNFDLLLEVELDASVRFGSRELELKELLELGPGDVVELDRNVADPVDLIVGDRIVARGEVVLVNGNFGLRVIEVAEPVRRLESIRCIA
ncbi:MAG: FliM/FliN family flagellar motor switch protein, partial [Acidobacteriaceae bacterium]